jgi:sialate O-acetylesterase
MKIETGLFDHIVWQQNQRGVSEAIITGTAETDGAIEVRILKSGRALPEWDGRSVGKTRQGKFRATIIGVPIGGPYRVELRFPGSRRPLVARDVLVGDVWLLAGQSNMQGAGRIEGALPPIDSVRAFYMDDRWAVARDPIHNLWESIDEAHELICKGRPPENIPRSVGPGVAFGQKTYEISGGVPQGLICCAHGGTNMEQWDADRANEGTRSLYGATLRRLRKNGGRVAGLLWYQGESDANEKDAPLYGERMLRLIAAFRRDTAHSRLPVVMAQIGRVVDRNEDEAIWWNSIQETQRLLPQKIRDLAVVPTIDLELDDSIHISGSEQARLGVRMAEAMHALRRGKKALPPPIALKRARLSLDKSTNLFQAEIEFDHVVGKLSAVGRPSGFSLVDDQGRNHVYRTLLLGKKVVLPTNLTSIDTTIRLLYHGRNCDPLCNILDSADRALPVFGPVPFGLWRVETPQVQKLEISDLQPAVKSWPKLRYPKEPNALGFAPRAFPDTFCNIHPELTKRAPETVLAYFRCRINCAEIMPLAIWLGYDGPLKVWFDGREIFSDPDGINPSMPNDAEIGVQATAGAHEILLALESNRGQAWGIFLRFERTDGRRKANQQRSELAVPQVLH